LALTIQNILHDTLKRYTMSFLQLMPQVSADILFNVTLAGEQGTSALQKFFFINVKLIQHGGMPGLKLN
jgi:hypothetical protein